MKKRTIFVRFREFDSVKSSLCMRSLATPLVYIKADPLRLSLAIGYFSFPHHGSPDYLSLTAVL